MIVGADRILELLRENNLDSILISSMYNVFYISGFSGDTAYLYISDKRQVLLTDSRYTTWARNESKGFEVVEVDSEHPYTSFVSKYLKEDNAKTIGFENLHMLYCDVMKFKENCDSAEFVCVDGKVDALRQIKTLDEIKKIRTAEQIGDDAFTHICKYIKSGMTERQIALELEMYMRKNGAQKLSFESIAASGPNSSMPHAVPGSREIENGDFVTLDFGCVFEGYCSDMTRTVAIGNVSDRQLEVYSIVLAAQEKAIMSVCEGKKGSEIDSAARDVINEAGYGDYFGHGLGHSVGLFIHEEPRFSSRDDTIIKENMVITVEPGIYIPNLFGVRIEDLIVVKKDGCENLTNSVKDLVRL